ncbi:MAG: hypothetical protein A2045_07315 [Rhodocyclales bacterium GWA2_65_20]|nr:MAG: hypothetical protein A2045_07315 [Rhodocyclales bacterium GWA2_65_20]
MRSLAQALALSLALHGLALALPAAQAPAPGTRVHGGTSAVPPRPALTVRLETPIQPAAENHPPAEQGPSGLSDLPGAAIPATATSVDTPLDAHDGPAPAYFPAGALSRLPEALTVFRPEVPESPGSRAGGRMELRLWLAQDGRIDRIQLLNTELPDALSDAALVAFGRMLFRPAEIQGVPVPSWSDIVVGFDPLPDPSDASTEPGTTETKAGISPAETRRIPSAAGN